MEHESGDYDKRRLKLLAIAAEFIVFYCVALSRLKPFRNVLIYVDVISNKQSIFSSQIRTPSFLINWPSLVSTAPSPVIL